MYTTPYIQVCAAYCILVSMHKNTLKNIKCNVIPSYNNFQKLTFLRLKYYL